MFNRIPGRGYLLIAILIFAAANSVTRKLTELGAENLIDGRNPISFCNVLFVGVVLTILLQPTGNSMMANEQGLNIGAGELMTAIGAVALAISSIISKVKLNSIPLGIFTIFRTAVGTLVFFSATLKLYGISHFMDVFAPIVWQWMLLYGVVIVVGGQLAWFKGLKSTDAADVSLASSISPIAGILAAFLILGEVPTIAQYIGGSVIIVGIIFSQIGTARQKDSAIGEAVKQMDEQIGFKGI